MDLVGDVDDEGVGERADGDPGAVSRAADLKSLGVVVGEEHREAAGIGVRREAEGQLRLRALGVEVDAHACSLFFLHSAERRGEAALLQPKPGRQRPHQPPAQPAHLRPVLLRHLAVSAN